MRFQSTALRGFRNLGTVRRTDWGPGLNLILGPNGAGKTNLLESLNVLSGWGTFSGRVSAAVAWDSPDGRALLAAWTSGERDVEVSALLSSRMTLKADGERISGSELRARLPSLSFLPTDIDLIDGPSSVRRRFLDRLCALCILPFARLGGWILESRRRVLDRMLEGLETEPSFFPLSLPFPFVLRAEPEIAGSGSDFLLGALEATTEREARACRPLAGPHRDDLVVSCLGRPASAALSRGQKRRLVVSLILMAGRFVGTYLRAQPVLLLDDLGAELDAAGRREAGSALLGTGWQVFVTGTENPFPEVPAQIYSLGF